MGCEAGWYNKKSTAYGIFTVISLLEEWPTKAKEEPYPHEVRLTSLNTNPDNKLSILSSLLLDPVFL